MFFFNDTATTEIYTLSLHDALPISQIAADRLSEGGGVRRVIEEVVDDLKREPEIEAVLAEGVLPDRKSTRLNSSHANISYAVFCLKKKKKYARHTRLYSPIPPTRHP